jgi:hypothetical protein
MKTMMNTENLEKSVNVPIELYESALGKYFIGYADELSIKKGTSTWAMLYNPQKSCVNLHVNVWTVTDISDSPFRAQFWFNSNPPGNASESSLVTPSNTAFRPVPQPQVRILKASNVFGEPKDGVKAFVRRGEPGTTVAEVENGKLIFPPGGSFLVFVTLTDPAYASGSARIAFGWWEEKIQ